MNCEEKISKCEEINSNPKIVINDPDGGKSEFRLKNFKRIKVRIIKVDDCVIEDDSTRCDFVIEIPMDNIKVVLFIELKGKNVEHGIKQLEKTINHMCFKNRYGSDLQKRAYVVGTKVRILNIPNIGEQNSIRRFSKEYKCELKIGEHIEVDIEQLLNRPSNKD
jgi:hypothetical protein